MMRSNRGKQMTQGPMKKKAGGKVAAGKPVKMQKGGKVPCASCPNPAACRKAGRCLMAG
jgi:hypothetical protein